jgi:thiamine-monophosphate kinase
VNAPASEFELIDRHFRRAPRHADVRVGIGDDAAVIAPTPGMELAVSVDMLVEGRHFFAGTDAEALGHKTLAVNLSDLAAMGAAPRYALLAGALPDADEAWLARFMQGFRTLAERHDVELIGGDTTRGPRNLCVTVIGEVPPGAAITRAGAHPGDDVYVSGALGAAALAVRALGGDVRLAHDVLARVRERLERPEPRVALGLALRGVATAALDVSDGLVGDLGHILERSGCAAVVELARLPADPAVAERLHGADRDVALACLLAGGDDYELCFTAPRAARERIDVLARELAVPATLVGTLERGHGLTVLDEHGRPLAPLPASFDHFG